MEIIQFSGEMKKFLPISLSRHNKTQANESVSLGILFANESQLSGSN